MVKWIMFLICSICIDAYSQVLRNVVTDEHSRVEATNIYLIVPDGFTWINRSREFLNATINASITINRIETPILVVHKQMSKSNALAQGIIVISEREIKLGGFKGYQFETNRNTHSEKFKSKLLIFGNDRETYSIQFIFPASRNDVEIIANNTLESVSFKEIVTNSKSMYSMDFKKFDFELLESKKK